MLSNLMNLGKKKPSSLDNPEKCVDTSGEEDHVHTCRLRARILLHQGVRVRACQPFLGLTVGLDSCP